MHRRFSGVSAAGRGGRGGRGRAGAVRVLTYDASAGGARGGSLERFAEVAFEALRPPAVAPISLSAGVGSVGGVGGVGGVAGFPSASLLPLSKSPTPADAGARTPRMSRSQRSSSGLY
ncbi:hypothetical protein HF086_009694 [Spodoptera exigua]|uniref:Uncharacterized protein n=1 Tax=Spodoptera exigua TaxID=7107 RepID=A0A922MU19_SPOEX|nr:hypothetical protein HF086_009694 [Spodoptera exigua]